LKKERRRRSEYRQIAPQVFFLNGLSALFFVLGESIYKQATKKKNTNWNLSESWKKRGKKTRKILC